MKEIKTNIDKRNVAPPKIKEERKELQQLLIQLADEKTEERFSDKNLDKVNEKIKLISGEIVAPAEIARTISESAREYSPVFTVETEYYSEMYRLKKWNVEDAKKYYKPPIVGKYTNELIYNRFSKEVLPILQHRNPFIGDTWLRKHRHFQWLTEDGQKQIEKFIREAVDVMKTCETWYEFRVKFFVEYNVSFQADAFVDTHKMIEDFKSKPAL